MVKYIASDIIPIAEFAYAWRIADAHWDELPDDLLKHIHPLSLQYGGEVCEMSSILRYHGPFYVNTERYHVVSDCSMKIAAPRDTQRIYAWLSNLPIQSCEEVYVSWRNRAVLVTEWGIFVTLWASFWYLDVLDVFDESLDWAVLFGPEEFAAFTERGSVDLQSPQMNRDAGYNLARILPSAPSD